MTSALTSSSPVSNRPFGGDSQRKRGVLTFYQLRNKEGYRAPQVVSDWGHRLNALLDSLVRCDYHSS